MKKMLKNSACLGLLIGGLVLVGCEDPNLKLEATTPTAKKESKEYVPMAAAGVGKDITKSMDPNRYRPLILATARFGHRTNPFALNKEEMAFDMAQAGERIFSEEGGFGTHFVLPEDKLDMAAPPEPQPYRRLSGILIGDSVLAILEENGKSTIVRPGMMIPGTDWRIVSIDQDRAILRREGDRLPKEIEVRLEVGFPAGGGNGGGGNGGGAPNGNPKGGLSQG